MPARVFVENLQQWDSVLGLDENEAEQKDFIQIQKPHINNYLSSATVPT